MLLSRCCLRQDLPKILKNKFWSLVVCSDLRQQGLHFSDRVANAAHGIHRVILADVLPQAFHVRSPSPADLVPIKRHYIIPFVVFTTWSFSLKFIMTGSILTALSSDPPDVDSSCFWNLPPSPVNLSVIVAEVVYVSVTDFIFFFVEPLRQEGVRVFNAIRNVLVNVLGFFHEVQASLKTIFHFNVSETQPVKSKISAMLQYPSSQLVLVWVELLSTSAISSTQLRSRRFDANFFKNPPLSSGANVYYVDRAIPAFDFDSESHLDFGEAWYFK